VVVGGDEALEALEFFACGLKIILVSFNMHCG
jgi:hypothetical protein